MVQLQVIIYVIIAIAFDNNKLQSRKKQKIMSFQLPQRSTWPSRLPAGQPASTRRQL